MRPRHGLLAALLLLPPAAGASGGQLDVTGQWRGMGAAPLAVSPDGTLVATTRPPRGQPYRPYDTWTEVRETARLTLLSRVQPANGDGKTLVFSPDSQALWSAHTRTVRYNARSGQLIEMAVGSDGPGVSALAFAPSGRSYALAVVNTVGDSSLWLMNTRSGIAGWRGTPFPPTRAQGQPSNWIHSLAFSPDGRVLTSGSGGGGIVLRGAGTGRRWGHLSDPAEAATPAMRRGWTAHPGAVTALGFVSPQRLVSASQDGRIKLWDTRTGRVLGRLTLPRGLNALRVTRGGRVLAATGEGLVLLDTRGGRLERRETLWNLQDPPTDMGVTADGRTVWTISRGGILTRVLLFGRR